MYRIYRLFCFIFLMHVVDFQLLAQLSVDNNDFLSESIENAKVSHDRKFEKSELLINGREYVDYDNRIKGNPYFLIDGFAKGDIIYQDNFFDSVNLKFDIHKDLLIIEHYDQYGYGTDVYLVNEWVEAFHIKDHYFKRLFDDEENPVLNPGFYQILLENDDATLISKRNKNLYEELEVNSITREFLLNDKYYLIRGDEIHKINNKRSVFKALTDRKKEMKKYVRKHKQFFKDSFEEAIVAAIEYYHDLNQ